MTEHGSLECSPHGTVERKGGRMRSTGHILSRASVVLSLLFLFLFLIECAQHFARRMQVKLECL